MTTIRLLAAAFLAAATVPALAQGIDSAQSPYPRTAYSGALRPLPVVRAETPSAYRYSGSHAGGPANAVIRR
ncbi:hypothetical protein [Methylobacterium sp. JK268]